MQSVSLRKSVAILGIVICGTLPAMSIAAEPAAAGAVATLPALDEAGAKVFNDQIAPLLVRYCLECHGPGDPHGGLDLSSREKALAGGDSGAAIVAGKPGESLLIERLRDGSMPPEGKTPRPTPTEPLGLRSKR
jgi:mono/diheme cytochrome c family protein